MIVKEVIIVVEVKIVKELETAKRSENSKKNENSKNKVKKKWLEAIAHYVSPVAMFKPTLGCGCAYWTGRPEKDREARQFCKNHWRKGDDYDHLACSITLL